MEFSVGFDNQPWYKGFENHKSKFGVKICQFCQPHVFGSVWVKLYRRCYQSGDTRLATVADDIMPGDSGGV